MDEDLIAGSSERNGDGSEPGWCRCGCGRRTNLAPQNNARDGWIKDEPLRYLNGHARRKHVRYIETPGPLETPCWQWQLAKTPKGYGWVWDRTGPALAHRVYYEAHHGPVPDGLELDHLCGERSCVNPDHMDAVSHAENCRRGRRAKLTRPEVAEILASSETQRVLARRFGVTPGHIVRIRKGRCWGDVCPAPAV